MNQLLSNSQPRSVRIFECRVDYPLLLRMPCVPLGVFIYVYALSHDLTGSKLEQDADVRPSCSDAGIGQIAHDTSSRSLFVEIFGQKFRS